MFLIMHMIAMLEPFPCFCPFDFVLFVERVFHVAGSSEIPRYERTCI
jgi:hypothetical protein